MSSQSHAGRPARLALAFLVSLGLLAGGAAPASAVVANNQTLISVNPVLTGTLKVTKVRLEPKGAAKIGSAGIYYPVTNAKDMSEPFIGTLKHQGAFQLRLGTLTFGARHFVIKTGNRKPVTGVLLAEPVVNGVGTGVKVPFSRIEVTSTKKESDGSVTAKYKLIIDPKIAQTINETLKVDLIKPGDAWATGESHYTRPAKPTKPAAK